MERHGETADSCHEDTIGTQQTLTFLSDRRQRSPYGQRSSGGNSGSSQREPVFEGTHLALGGPRRHRSPPLAASPATEHSLWRVGVTGQASDTRSLTASLLTRPPAASLTGPSISLCQSGSTSHLGSTEAPSFSGSAAFAQLRQGPRHHKKDTTEQLPVVSDNDFYSHLPFDVKSNKLTSDL